MKRLQTVQPLDDIDAQLLGLLAENARMTVTELSRRVGLSGPSVSDRLRRLEAEGAIRGYTIDIDPRALGYTLQAIVRVRPLPGMLHLVERLIEETPAFVECDKVTGEDCFIARLYLHAIEELDGILDRLAERAETNTMIVKATPVPRRLPPIV